jgi:hypothetical protein
MLFGATAKGGFVQLTYNRNSIACYYTDQVSNANMCFGLFLSVELFRWQN